MTVLSIPTITNAQYMLEFSKVVSKIRYEQAMAESAFNGLVSDQSQQTNIPDEADPLVPRITFGANGRSISISQAQCRIEFNFAEKALGIDRSLEIIGTNITKFHNRAINNFKVAAYEVNALVLMINVPSNDSIESLNKYLFDRFIKIQPIDKLASTQIHLGFKVEQCFVNIAARVFEVRSGEFKNLTPGASHMIKMRDMRTIQQGLSFQIEVNNRPASELDEYKVPETPVDIIDLTKRFLLNDFEKITGIPLK